LGKEKNKNRWWLNTPLVIATHKKPDEDSILSVALLKMAGAKIEGYWFYGEGDAGVSPQFEFKNVVWIDRGRRDFDHHGIQGKTSTHIIAEALGISNEKWLQPILRHVKRADLEGRSEPMDLNDMIKSISRELNDDLQIMEIGVKIATAIIEFYQKGMKRNNKEAAIIIKEFFGDEKMPERIRHYYQLLQNPNFSRPLDFGELATVNAELAKQTLQYIVADIKRYQEAEADVRKAKKIRVGRYFVFAGESDNPKFNVKAREMGAAIVIQRNSDGHVQIFFNNKILGAQVVEIAEDLIEVLRLKEISLDPDLSKNLLRIKSILRSTGKIEEVPQWYFFKGEKGGCLILNGSLTSPDVPVTRIPLEEIIEFTKDTLRNYLENNLMGRRRTRRGSSYLPRSRRKPGRDKALSHH